MESTDTPIGSEVEPPLLITVPAAAALIGCSRSYLYAEIQRGALPLLHLGRASRLLRADVVDFVDRKRERALRRQDQLRAQRQRSRRRRQVTVSLVPPPGGTDEPHRQSTRF